MFSIGSFPDGVAGYYFEENLAILVCEQHSTHQINVSENTYFNDAIIIDHLITVGGCLWLFLCSLKWFDF